MAERITIQVTIPADDLGRIAAACARMDLDAEPPSTPEDQVAVITEALETHIERTVHRHEVEEAKTAAAAGVPSYELPAV